MSHERIFCDCGNLISQCRCMDCGATIKLIPHPACGRLPPATKPAEVILAQQPKDARRPYAPPEVVTLDDALDRMPRDALDLLEEAWGVIANVGNGNWETQKVEWREAATRWRVRYHDVLLRRGLFVRPGAKKT